MPINIIKKKYIHTYTHTYIHEHIHIKEESSRINKAADPFLQTNLCFLNTQTQTVAAVQYATYY